MAQPAAPVTSWFVPQNVLDQVAPSQAQAAADQARNTFMFGLLSGDIGAAYNNAQNQGYNALSHAMSLAEANRKNQSNDALMQAARGAFVPVPGTGVGQPGAPDYQPPQFKFDMNRFIQDPRVPMALATNPKALQDVIGPDLINVNGMLVDKKNPSNAERHIPNLPTGGTIVGKDAAGNPIYGFAPGVTGMIATDAGIRASTNQYHNVPQGTTRGPKGELVIAPNLFNYLSGSSGATAAGKQPFNTTPNTQTTMGPDGKLRVDNLPGGVDALGQQTFTQELMKNMFNLRPTYDRATDTFRDVPVSVSALGGLSGGGPIMTGVPGAPGVPGAGAPGVPGAPATGGAPLTNFPVSAPGAGTIAGAQAEGGLYGKQLEQWMNQASTAGSRITNAKLLMNVSDRIDGNKLTPVEAEVKSYLNALGITGDATKQFLNDVNLFSAFRLEKLKDQVSMFKGSQSEKELAVLLDMGQNLSKPADVNRLYSGFEIANANRDRLIADALRTYDGPKTPQAVQAFINKQEFMNKPLFADPVFKDMKVGGQAVQRIVEMDGKRYMTIPFTKDVIPLN